MLLSKEYREKVERLISNKHDSRRADCTATTVATYYKATYLDPSFQRKGGVYNGSGWTFEQSQGYLDNFFSNKVKNRIILAHVESCYNYAVKKGDKRSEEYFGDLKKKGYHYVSIDGNNTSSTIYAALYGEEVPKKYSKKEKKFVKERLVSKVLKEYFPASGGIFSKLPIDVREGIINHPDDGLRIGVEVLHEIGLDEMTEMFRALNTQTSLNNQENRQARVSPLAQFIRDTVVKYRDSLAYFTYANPEDFDKLRPDEVLATFACKVHNSYSGDVKHGDLDNFYEDVLGLNSEDEKKINQVFEGLESISNSNLVLKNNINKGALMSLMDLLLACDERGLKIKNHKELFLCFEKHRIKLHAESKEVPEEEAREKSYTWWNARLGSEQFYTKIRQTWENWIDSEEKNFIRNGVLSKPRTSSHSFTKKQKQEALVAQDFKDREGNDIFESYIEGELHADHVIPVSQGGETEVFNCEMMLARDNLKKGAKANEPYFPHQKQ